MDRRLTSALLVAVLLAGCGGNPFTAPDKPVVPVNPEPPPEVPDDLIPIDAVSGDVEAVGLADWSAGAGTIRVRMDAQVLPEVTGDFARDTAFDVTSGGITYHGYSFQSSVLNRKAVVLVAGSGSVKAAVAMEPGQFAGGVPDMYHSGGALYRATAYRAPAGGLFNYVGTYAGMLNSGPAAGTPPGSLVPTSPHRTSGSALITADFTRMKLSGGVTGRTNVDTGEQMADIALWTTGISTTGTFDGIVYRGDNAPALDPLDQRWTAAGRYDGVFGSVDASDVALIMLFDPVGGGALWEQGIIVGPCTASSSGACP